MAATADGETQIVAVLHDVVEDSDWTIERLRGERFSETALSGVDAVTRREREPYIDFVKRAKADALGRIVKRADLLDNLDRTRLKNVTAKDEERIKRYEKALSFLERPICLADNPIS